MLTVTVQERISKRPNLKHILTINLLLFAKNITLRYEVVLLVMLAYCLVIVCLFSVFVHSEFVVMHVYPVIEIHAETPRLHFQTLFYTRSILNNINTERRLTLLASR